jgi:hypothetical protein
MDDDEGRSILSHGEREIARMRRDGMSVEAIADARDDSPEAVEKALDRIRTKTDRALLTLLQSPVTEPAVDDLDPDTRETIRSRLTDNQ